jgi:hypothetical protein
MQVSGVCPALRALRVRRRPRCRSPRCAASGALAARDKRRDAGTDGIVADPAHCRARAPSALLATQTREDACPPCYRAKAGSRADAAEAVDGRRRRQLRVWRTGGLMATARFRPPLLVPRVRRAARVQPGGGGEISRRRASTRSCIRGEQGFGVAVATPAPPDVATMRRSGESQVTTDRYLRHLHWCDRGNQCRCCRRSWVPAVAAARSSGVRSRRVGRVPQRRAIRPVRCTRSR